MKSYFLVLNIQVDAHDQEEALSIAQTAKHVLESMKFPFKLEIDIDTVELVS